MNYTQQQKAQKYGINPETLNVFYISHVNTERGLLYLSVDSVRFFPVLKKNEEIELGYVLKGVIIDIRSNGVIVRDPLGISAFIHKTMLSERLENYVLGQQIAVQKKGYDIVNRRHIWQAWRAVPSLR